MVAPGDAGWYFLKSTLEDAFPMQANSAQPRSSWGWYGMSHCPAMGPLWAQKDGFSPQISTSALCH